MVLIEGEDFFSDQSIIFSLSQLGRMGDHTDSERVSSVSVSKNMLYKVRCRFLCSLSKQKGKLFSTHAPREVQINACFTNIKRSGRVLDSRPRGHGYEPHWRRCVVSFSKNINPNLVLVQPRKTHLFITERLLIGCKTSNQTNKICRLSFTCANPTFYWNNALVARCTVTSDWIM